MAEMSKTEVSSGYREGPWQREELRWKDDDDNWMVAVSKMG